MKKLILFVLLLSSVVLNCDSSKSMSRDKAAAILKSAWDGKKIANTFQMASCPNGKNLYINYSESDYDEQHNSNAFGDQFVQAEARWIELEKKGFLKCSMLEKKVPNWGGGPDRFLGTDFKGEPQHFPGMSRCPERWSCSYYDSFLLEFTPTATPYVQFSKTVQFSVQNVDVTVTQAVFDKILVVGLTEPSDMMGQKVIKADYIAEYKLTPLGRVYLSDNSEELKKTNSAIFVLYDDGWRLAQR